MEMKLGMAIARFRRPELDPPEDNDPDELIAPEIIDVTPVED